MAWTSRFGKKMRSTMSRTNDMICTHDEWPGRCRVILFGSPVRIPTGPTGIGVRQTKTADTIVLEAPDIEVALVLAHRRYSWMGHPAGIPERLAHVSGIIKLDHASEIDTRTKPF